MDPGAHFIQYDGTYLLSHSIGLPVRGDDLAARSVLDAWQHDPVGAWPHWLATIDAFCASIASLVGTTPDLVCPQPNVTSGLTKILGSLDREQLRILLAEDAFPSIGFACRQHGDHDVRMLRREENASDPATWEHHLRDGVDVVVITHVHSNTGELIPVDLVAAAAHRAGATVVVDVAQSAGIIPIDLADWSVDFVIGSCVKWLSGGPGAGWLWAAPNAIERAEPRDVGWFSHEDPFEFDIEDFRYAPDARRFWGGTPSVLPFAVARHAIDAIVEIGVAAIRAANQAHLDHLVDRLGERVASPHDPGRRGGTCIVSGGPELVDRLASERIAVDHRRRGIRLSPHVYTTSDDIDRLAERITASD